MMETICSKETYDYINKLLHEGYSIEELPNDERVNIEFWLSRIENIDSELCFEYEEETTIDKIKREIAEEVVNEIKERLYYEVVDLIYSIEDDMACEDEDE